MMYIIHHLEARTRTKERWVLWRRRPAGGFDLRLEWQKTAGGTPAPLRPRLREEHMEAGAARGVLLEADCAAVVVHDFGDDGQTEAHAFLLRCEKRIENLLAQFGRDAGAGIFDEYGHTRLAIRDFRLDHDVQYLLR